MTVTFSEKPEVQGEDAVPMSSLPRRPPPVAQLEKTESMIEPHSSAAGSEGPPRNVFDAAERGLVGYIIRAVERTIEFNINQTDKYHRTMMHWAAELGHVEVIEALKDYGAKVDALDCNRRTPVHLAAKGMHLDVLKVLMEDLDFEGRKALVNQGDNVGVTPVFLALQGREKSIEVFEYMMQECGAEYNVLHRDHS